MANPKSFDPRSEAEKARADLKRNSEMDMALPESPPERLPSVTPDTFGVSPLGHASDPGVRPGSNRMRN